MTAQKRPYGPDDSDTAPVEEVPTCPSQELHVCEHGVRIYKVGGDSRG